MSPIWPTPSSCSDTSKRSVRSAGRCRSLRSARDGTKTPFANIAWALAASHLESRLRSSRASCGAFPPMSDQPGPPPSRTRPMTAIESLPPGLIHAPQGRDAVLAQALLAEANVSSSIVADLSALAAGLTEDVAFVVLTIEALRGVNLRPLIDRLSAQPAWSDIPIVILTQRGGGLERNPEAARLSEALGNVSFLERPFHPTTFVSVVRTALKSRQRQLEARSRIDEIREAEANLRTALSAGRLGSWQLDLATQELTSSAV